MLHNSNSELLIPTLRLAVGAMSCSADTLAGVFSMVAMTYNESCASSRMVGSASVSHLGITNAIGIRTHT